MRAIITRKKKREKKNKTQINQRSHTINNKKQQQHHHHHRQQKHNNTKFIQTSAKRCVLKSRKKRQKYCTNIHSASLLPTMTMKAHIKGMWRNRKRKSKVTIHEHRTVKTNNNTTTSSSLKCVWRRNTNTKRFTLKYNNKRKT